MPDSPSTTGPSRNVRLAERVFLFALALIGIWTYGDYGVPWDEMYQRPYGDVVYNYVLYGEPALTTHHDRYHGPVFEFILTAGEKVFGLTDSRDIYRFRHLLTFALFWAAVAAMLPLGRRIFRRAWMPLLAAILLVLMPRIVTEAFYNTKDLPFLSLWIIAMLTMARLLERPSPGRALTHALACAALIGVRILGVFIPVLTLALLAAEWLRSKERRSSTARTAALYAAVTPLLTILLWPALWEHPLRSFLEAAVQMGNFPWNQTVWYGGAYVPAADLPWHYLPVWIGATVPEITVVLAACGLPFVLWRTVREPWAQSRIALSVAAWCILPLAGAMLLRPVIYDGWRHFYFIAPAIALLGAAGMEWMLCAIDRADSAYRKPARRALTALLAIPLLLTAVWIARHHPQQHVYFSSLAGGISGAKQRFELDYWGLSYRQALEEIVRRDDRSTIRISVENDPGRLNVEMLPQKDRARIEITDRQNADYHLTNHRWHYGESHGGHLFGIAVDGVEILGVYRAKDF